MDHGALVLIEAIVMERVINYGAFDPLPLPPGKKLFGIF